jgi:hypothetical protein
VFTIQRHAEEGIYYDLIFSGRLFPFLDLGYSGPADVLHPKPSENGAK